MSFPAAEGPDTEAVVETTSQQGPSATPTEHSIKPDHDSSEFVDAPEEPMADIDSIARGSEKATSSPSKKTSSQSKKSKNTDVSFTFFF